MRFVFFMSVLCFLISGCSKQEMEVVANESPTELYHCDKSSYPEAAFERNGKKVTVGMDQENFIYRCSDGNHGIWSAACSYYQSCVSQVKQHKDGLPLTELVDLDFREVAEYLKSQNKHTKTLVSEKCHNGICSKVVEAAMNACSAATESFNPVLAGDKIFEHIAEVTYEESRLLGQKAVKSYGTCLCVIHNYLSIDDDYSIGYCIGDEFIECKGRDSAFCGRKVNR